MIEIRDPANISMLDPIERVALGMVGSSSNSPPLQVQEFQDEEGRIETMTDDQMYLMLGLGDEDERAKMAAPANSTQEGDAHVSSVEGGASQANVVLGDSVGEVMEGAAIPVDDLVPLERMIIYDKDKPQIKLGSMFPSMNEFRLAVRQYAINEEFELATEKSCTTKFRGHCKAKENGCPWQIIGNKKSGLPTITVMANYHTFTKYLRTHSCILKYCRLPSCILTLYSTICLQVTLLVDEHKCTSSSRIKTTMASQAWVADKAVPLLRKTPGMGAKQLQKKLQEDHNVTIGYDTVWRGERKSSG